MQTRTLSLGSRQRELIDFFASLPAEHDVTDVLGSIFASAKVTGVEFKQAEYKPESQNNPRVEYGIIIPARGEYPRIRLFVASVLANNPAVALDQINFQREHVNDATVKSEIRFTLFLRPEIK
jgi:Tfp pilus assembly protein PilO